MTDPKYPHSEESSLDGEDLNLVAFLKANRPPTPAPHPDAEARLMHSIAQSPQTAPPPQATRRTLLKRSWLIGAIALGSALIGSVLWQFRPQNSGVLAQQELELEAFLIETWEDISTEDSLAEFDWLAPQESISQSPTLSQALVYPSHLEESHP